MDKKMIDDMLDYYCNGECDSCRVKHVCHYPYDYDDDKEPVEILCRAAFCPNVEDKRVFQQIIVEAAPLYDVSASKTARKRARAKIEGMLIAYEKMTGIHAVYDVDEILILEGNTGIVLYE